MAYTSSDLNLSAHSPLADNGTPVGTNRWSYFTAGDSMAVIGASSYITDAAKKGLKPGDYIQAYCSSGPTMSGYLVKTVRSSLSSGSADLSSGMWLSS